MKVNCYYGGVVYVFFGSIEVVKVYIYKGLYLGIGGIVIYLRVFKICDILVYLFYYFLGYFLLEIDVLDMFMFGW